MDRGQEARRRPEPGEALRRFKDWRATGGWRKRERSDAWSEICTACFHSLTVPQGVWKQIRTTNYGVSESDSLIGSQSGIF